MFIDEGELSNDDSNGVRRSRDLTYVACDSTSTKNKNKNKSKIEQMTSHLNISTVNKNSLSQYLDAGNSTPTHNFHNRNETPNMIIELMLKHTNMVTND